jgi:hypothetical protein
MSRRMLIGSERFARLFEPRGGRGNVLDPGELGCRGRRGGHSGVRHENSRSFAGVVRDFLLLDLRNGCGSGSQVPKEGLTPATRAGLAAGVVRESEPRESRTF